jgi:3-methyl-2-oxobutanoate hydroxymethyltransferase
MERKKIDATSLFAKKNAGEKITMLTAYDYPTAVALDEAGVDTILVGDSAGNVVLGYPDTIPVTMDEMIMLSKAVVRGVKYAYVIGDMPFMSYNITVPDSIINAGRFVKEAGCDAIKLEGGKTVEKTVRAIVNAGISVVGHLGLTPQTASQIGGYRVQGRDAETASLIVDDAQRLEDAGINMLVLECVPDRVAQLISEKVAVPTIGIGAGADTDGQVLVVSDLLGIRSGFTPKFVKRYAALNETIIAAAKEYIAEVSEKKFPAEEHIFNIKDEEFEKLKAKLKK